MTLSASNKDTLARLAGLAIILLAVVFCIWPGMHSPLFSDDTHQLVKTKEFHKWTDVFNVDVFGYYRPVKNALFKLAAPLEGDLVAWHWIGVIAYLGATAGVFRIATICLGSRRPAWLATCLWALSPACVSTVIWLSCANISVGIIFAACAFHCHERWVERHSLKWLVPCGLFFALALLCYESLIALPALLFLRDFQQRRLSFDRSTIIRYGVYTLVALAFLIVRHEFSARAVGGDNMNAGLAPGTKAIHMSLSAPWFLWRHFLMWIFPFGTIEVLGSYDWLRSASAASLVLGWLFLIAMLVSAFLTRERHPVIAFGLLFFVIASIPSGNFLPCYNGPIYDAYVTIPSIGLALVVAMVCEILIRQISIRRGTAGSGSVIFMVILGLLLFYRLPVCGTYFRYWAGVWGKPVELMLLTSESRPLQSQAKGFASLILFSEGYIDQAAKLGNEVIRDVPWDTTAKLTLARVAEYREDAETAEKYYRQILDEPKGSRFVKNPALLELAALLAGVPERSEEAAQLLRGFLKTPEIHSHPQAIALLSLIYKDEGNIEKARATLVRGMSLHPDDQQLPRLLDSVDHPVLEPQKN